MTQRTGRWSWTPKKSEAAAKPPQAPEALSVMASFPLPVRLPAALGAGCRSLDEEKQKHSLTQKEGPS
ncbi:hypothetical protein [Planococcus sp. ISL-110]|uniref:hypothetical protein n=1 Tax=Planococcus sp. ISL-110 TaxID=2819167 RepID=UPI001BE90677|nr:hypothetical protein [Planococcus sp. ISL-110]MBT2570599.1 hypothetical protein [Planococcus sp. ISL-110]